MLPLEAPVPSANHQRGAGTGISISGMKEVGMTQEMILGMAAFVVSIGAVLYVRLRRPAYVMVRRSSREHPRVR